MAVTIYKPHLHVKVSLYRLDGTLINWVADKKLPSRRRVECPEALTRVTGCKLQKQGLPEVDGLITAEQAAKDNSFWKQGSTGKMYETTTMEDCCRPSCAAANWVEKKGLKVDPAYNVFYSCDRAGVPLTEPE